jgi:hypothetical protein
VVDHCLCGDPECVANAADIPWEFIEPWNTCIICKQSFQDQLSLDLTSACVSFAESKYSRNEEVRLRASQNPRLLLVANNIYGDRVRRCAHVCKPYNRS